VERILRNNQQATLYIGLRICNSGSAIH
jgi:hypothetical protein